MRVAADGATAAASTWDGDSRVVDLGDGRSPAVFGVAVDANLVHPHTVVPVLRTHLEIGDHELGCAVRAAPDVPAEGPPARTTAASALLAEISERTTETDEPAN